MANWGMTEIGPCAINTVFEKFGFIFLIEIISMELSIIFGILIFKVPNC